MKKFGFLLALIAVLAMGTSAFATVTSGDVRLILSGDVGSWDATGYEPYGERGIEIGSEDLAVSYDVSFTMYAGQKATLKTEVSSKDAIYLPGDFQSVAVHGLLSRDPEGADGVMAMNFVFSADAATYSGVGSAAVSVSGDAVLSSKDIILTVTFKKPVAQPTVGAVSFSKNDGKGLASKDVSVTWVVNDDATAGQFASESTEIKDIKVAVNGVVSTDIANGVSIADAERAKLRIVISMDKVVSDDVISYDAKAVISGDNGDGVIREYSATINGKFVITSSDTPGPGPVPDPDPVKPTPTPTPVKEELIPDGNTTLETPKDVKSASADVKDAITTDKGKALITSEGTLNTIAVEAALKEQKLLVVKGATVVTPEPFKAEIVNAGRVAIVQVDVEGKFNDLSKVKFVKLKADGNLEVSDKWAKTIGALGDKGFTFLESNGLTPTDVSKDVKYLVIAVKDDGDFDLDKTPKKVMDPAMFAEMESEKKGGGSSSSGCSAGYAPFALLLAAPLFFFRKRG